METILRGGEHLNSQNVLRLNVGFMLNKSVGYSRNFEFEETAVRLGNDLELTDLLGTIRLTKTSQGVYARGTFHSHTSLECVRCLMQFEQDLQLNLEELFAYPPSPGSDPLLNIPENGFLDLGPIVRELSVLEIPIQPLCQKDCRGLCAECGGNLNENECNHAEEKIDPRLEALKSLLDKS